MEPLHSVEEVARLLKISTRTVKRFVAAGHLQVIRFGRVARISDAELTRFLREGTQPRKAPEPRASIPKTPAPIDSLALQHLYAALMYITLHDPAEVTLHGCGGLYFARVSATLLHLLWITPGFES
jgi:excisionase family DNA binding protein